jgi:hypothetical protein
MLDCDPAQFLGTSVSWEVETASRSTRVMHPRSAISPTGEGEPMSKNPKGQCAPWSSDPDPPPKEMTAEESKAAAQAIKKLLGRK